jgi:NAD-dependent dihydropyrimidine dehydrogenase PreA subunit
MTYIIAEPCIKLKDAACVSVCPVDCIHPRKDEAGFEDEVQLYINPGECIDCGARESVCRVSAIFPEAEVPEKWKGSIQANYNYWKKK